MQSGKRTTGAFTAEQSSRLSPPAAANGSMPVEDGPPRWKWKMENLIYRKFAGHLDNLPGGFPQSG
jgi:hypothetical protein